MPAKSWVVVAASVLVAAAIRGWLASRVSTPWIFSDELVHSELAKSLAGGSFFDVRGRHVNVTYAYPLVLAPAWFLHSMASTYAAAKAINIALVSLAAVPVYVWGRRLLSPFGAAVAAVLTLLLPELALTSALMQENLAFLLFLVAALALWLVIESPSPWRVTLLVCAVVLASAARFELLLLVVIVPTAVVFAGSARRLAGLLVPFVGAGAAMLVVALVEPGRLQRALQVFPQATASYGAGRSIRWFVTSLGDLVLVTGVIPVVALVLLTWAAKRGESDGERAFLAVTWASVLWFMVLGALSGTWAPLGVKERYFFYLQPLLILALLRWIERGAPRALRIAIPVLLVLVVVIWAFPLHQALLAPGLVGNALGLEVFGRLGNRLGFAHELRGVLIVGVLGAGLLAVFARGRALRLGLPAVLGVFLLVSSAFAARSVDRQAQAVARTALLPANHSWIDAAVGRDHPIVLLNASNFMPETAAGEWWPIWAPWWGTEFWNRGASAVDDLGSPEPAPFFQRSGRLRWADGVVVGVPHAARVLIDPRFEVVGRRRGASRTFVLYDRVAAPMRLASATEGVFRDGESSRVAAYDRWLPRTRGLSAVRVRLERDPARGPTRVQITVGTLAARGNTPIVGHRTFARSMLLDRAATVMLPVPRPPSRVVIRFARTYPRADGTLIGGTVQFETVSAR